MNNSHSFFLSILALLVVLAVCTAKCKLPFSRGATYQWDLDVCIDRTCPSLLLAPPGPCVEAHPSLFGAEGLNRMGKGRVRGHTISVRDHNKKSRSKSLLFIEYLQHNHTPSRDQPITVPTLPHPQTGESARPHRQARLDIPSASVVQMSHHAPTLKLPQTRR